jgi:hypothetical protein
MIFQHNVTSSLKNHVLSINTFSLNFTVPRTSSFLILDQRQFCYFEATPHVLTKRAGRFIFFSHAVWCIILWRIDAFIGNDGKHIPAEAYARNNRTSIARQRISKQAFSTIERLVLLRDPCRGVIKGQGKSLEGVVENLVDFWRWHSKVIEKKWQEMN